jgi:hypothetical protein
MYTVVIPKVVLKPTKLVNKKTGEMVSEQLVMINHPEYFTPVQASVLVDDNSKAYEPGIYEMSSDSLKPGAYGRPEFRLVIGKRIDGAAKKAA